MRAERDKQVKLRNQLDIALALLGECENKRKHAVNLIEAVRREARDEDLRRLREFTVTKRL